MVHLSSLNVHDVGSGYISFMRFGFCPSSFSHSLGIDSLSEIATSGNFELRSMDYPLLCA
jgi:hypothetical protein